jgi:protein-disulfide isomerase
VSIVTMIIAALVLAAVGVRSLTTKPVVSTARAAQPAEQIPKEPLSLAGAAVKGKPDAPVALVMYSDFQCPGCGKFALDVLPAVEKTYVETGKVLLAFRYFPLERIHLQAFGAAVAAECAGAQGKFWPMHDSLFHDQKQMDEQSFLTRAGSLGLVTPDFRACLSGPAISRVRQQIKDSGPLTLRGTPTIFIGRVRTDGLLRVVRRFFGVPHPEEISAALEDALMPTGAQDKAAR